MNTWNDFFGPLIYLNDPSKQTLALGLLQLKGQFSSQWNIMMAAFYINDDSCVSLVFLRSKVFHSRNQSYFWKQRLVLPRNKKIEKERTTMNRPEYPRPQFERKKWLNFKR